MQAIAIPETTARLLAAIQNCGNVSKVIISRGQITYLPIKTRETSPAIEQAGLSDMVQAFVTTSLRKSVEAHFRLGTYDVSGRNQIVIS